MKQQMKKYRQWGGFNNGTVCCHIDLMIAILPEKIWGFFL
jgi:hypothetical protein